MINSVDFDTNSFDWSSVHEFKWDTAEAELEEKVHNADQARRLYQQLAEDQSVLEVHFCDKKAESFQYVVFSR